MLACPATKAGFLSELSRGSPIGAVEVGVRSTFSPIPLPAVAGRISVMAALAAGVPLWFSGVIASLIRTAASEGVSVRSGGVADFGSSCGGPGTGSGTPVWMERTLLKRILLAGAIPGAGVRCSSFGWAAAATAVPFADSAGRDTIGLVSGRWKSLVVVPTNCGNSSNPAISESGFAAEPGDLWPLASMLSVSGTGRTSRRTDAVTGDSIPRHVNWLLMTVACVDGCTMTGGVTPPRVALESASTLCPWTSCAWRGSAGRLGSAEVAAAASFTSVVIAEM